MLTPEQVKPYLLHEDRPVRKAAVDYFEDTWPQDTALLPLILQACRQYGADENLHGLVACRQFPLTGASLDEVLESLAATNDSEIAWHLCRVLISASIDLLLSREAAILDTPNLIRGTADQINRRKEFRGWSTSKLWTELQDFAQQSQGKMHVGDIDHAYADCLVATLSMHDQPPAAVLCNLLASIGEDQGWLEIFLIDLAGARRLPQTVPLLVERFRIDTDHMLERASDALAKIGDPEAVRLIRAAFPEESWHFKNYTSGVLGKIRSQESEDALLSLLETETDVSIRTMLCCELCRFFPERGVEVVRRQVRSGYDRTIVCLEDMLLPVAHALGIALPEADEWRAEREEREKRYEERRAELAELGRRYEAVTARGIDPFSEPGGEGEPVEEKLTPQRLDQPKTGRNAPCPCGSGKKHKKCCGRRPR
jgi:hypothetical protein